MAFGITISDPLGFIASLKAQTKIFQWVSLLFQMALSSVVSFCFTTGSMLIAHASTPVSIGSGLCTVAVVLSVFFGSSPLTKGMMLVRPSAEAKAQIEADMATTIRPPETK